MSVQQTDTIDFMGHDPKTNIFWLCMTEERPWGQRFIHRDGKLALEIAHIDAGNGAVA